MTIIWSDDAILSVDNTADYVRDKFGALVSDEFYQEVVAVSSQLEEFPESGAPEDALAGARHEYRSIAVGDQNRLIYRIDGDTIRVEFLWNTKMNPLRLPRMFD